MRLALLLVVVLAGCTPHPAVRPDARPERPMAERPEASQPPARPTTRPRPTRPGEDVVVDGLSILGPWRAVEVVGDAAATRDLRDGTLTTALIVRPLGSATLTGTDRRVGTGPVRLDGRVAGRRLAFSGLGGAATLSVWDGRLFLDDPRGRRTVFVRE